MPRFSNTLFTPKYATAGIVGALIVGTLVSFQSVSSWHTRAASESSPSSSTVIPDMGTVLVIDVEQKSLSLVQDGRMHATYPIVGFGNTDLLPKGQARVTTMRTDHVSLLERMHFPYAIMVGTHGLIHGWPYDNEGAPAPTSYRGGGVRLSSKDAHDVFRFVTPDTVVVVVPHDQRPIPFHATPNAHSALSSVTAPGFIVADAVSGAVLLARDHHITRPIASITKLLTALVVRRYAPPNELFQYHGMWYPRDDLISLLLLASDNELAEVLANTFGRDRFMLWMREEGQAIGMNASAVADPSGFSPENVSTPADLALLGRHLFLEHPDLLAQSRRSETVIVSEEGVGRVVESQNRLAGDAMFIGGKIGFTDEAKKTALSIVSVTTPDGPRTLVVVVLGARDWKIDTEALIRHVATAPPTHE